MIRPLDGVGNRCGWVKWIWIILLQVSPLWDRREVSYRSENPHFRTIIVNDSVILGGNTSCRCHVYCQPIRY